MDQDQDQVRGHGHLQCGRYSGWTDPVDEGDCRGRVLAAQDRHGGRSRPPDPRQHPTVGNPIKLSDSPAKVERSPLLGEHTEEILTKVLGYNAAQLNEIKASGAITPPKKEDRRHNKYRRPDAVDRVRGR